MAVAALTRLANQPIVMNEILRYPTFLAFLVNVWSSVARHYLAHERCAPPTRGHR